MNITNRLGQKMRELPQGVGYTLGKNGESYRRGRTPLEKMAKATAGGAYRSTTAPLQKNATATAVGGRGYTLGTKRRELPQTPPPGKIARATAGGPTPLEKMARTTAGCTDTQCHKTQQMETKLNSLLHCTNYSDVSNVTWKLM